MEDHIEQDFEKIVEEHGDVVYRVAYRILGNQPDAEDATRRHLSRRTRTSTGFEETRR